MIDIKVPGYGRIDAGYQDGQLIDQSGRNIGSASSIDESIKGEVEMMSLRIKEGTKDKLTLKLRWRNIWKTFSRQQS